MKLIAKLMVLLLSLYTVFSVAAPVYAADGRTVFTGVPSGAVTAAGVLILICLIVFVKKRRNRDF